MIDTYILLATLAITLATFVTRSGPHLLGDRLKIPPTFDSALRFAPACALAAIITPDLVYADGALNLTFSNPRWLAGLAAAAIFAASRSMIATISGGMAVFWALRAWI